MLLLLLWAVCFLFFVFFGTFPEKLRWIFFSPKLPLLKSLVTPALPQLNWISYKAAFAFSGHEAAAAGERERLVVSAALDRR